MEVGNHEGECEWWTDCENDYQYQENEPYHNEVNYSGFAGKGKGINWTLKGKGKGQSKGFGKSGIYQKGGNKGKSKGKGKKGSFQGECHWCGKKDKEKKRKKEKNEKKMKEGKRKKDKRKKDKRKKDK